MIAQNPYDLPFGALYVMNAENSQLLLKASSLLDYESQNRLQLADTIPLNPIHPDTKWPFAKLIESGKPIVVEETEIGNGEESRPWPEAVTRSVMLPISKAGQSSLAGVLVVGVSPRLE